MASPSEITTGAIQPSTTWGEFNNINFAISQAISKLKTATVVRVISCTNDGDLNPVGFVNVLPLVNQLDGNGNAVPHTTLYNLPYLRVQGGVNAIIIDPQAGDLGIAVFASRDISKVKVTKDQANPGSLRRYHFSDGMYLGGLLNSVPTQFIQFVGSTINLQAPYINLQGSTDGATPNLAVGPSGLLFEGGSAAMSADSGPISFLGQTSISGNLEVSSGDSGTFVSSDGKVITVQNGAIISIQ